MITFKIFYNLNQNTKLGFLIHRETYITKTPRK